MTTSETTTERREPGWTADASTFGARLALIRQHMGWGNIAKAAKECGVPTDSWRNWEVDGREPHRLITIAVAIATKTGCDLDWLVYGPNGKATPPNGRYGAARVLTRITAQPETSSDRLSEQAEGPSWWARPVRQTQPRVADSRRPHKTLAR